MKYFAVVIFIFLLILSCEKDDKNKAIQAVADSVTLGSGYTNDIFYSLEDGEILSAPRNTWDIAFSTGVMSWSILINSGTGVELYYVSNDTNDYHNVTDSVGFTTWTRLHNSLTDWAKGAFSNIDGNTDVFNFGWGIYNPGTHNVNGAGVYALKLQDGSWKKFFIRQKNGGQNIFYFLFADINGNNENIVVLALNPYADNEYVHYSLSSNAIIDYEPVKVTWDLLFTNYLIPDIGQKATGVLSKPGVKVMKVEGVSNETADTTMGQFSSEPAAIGHEWKTFDHNTISYHIIENLTYFVKTTDNKVYKIYFTNFDLTSGKMVFVKKEIK